MGRGRIKSRAWALGFALRAILPALTAASLAGGTAAAPSHCQISVAAMSVHMEGLRPMVSGEINGAPVRFLVDTGAGYSMLPKASADALHLPIYPAPDWLTFEGVGGGFRPELARVANLRIDGAQTSNVEFVVGGTDVFGAAAGLLGQNFWRIRDLELDFSHGALRFVQPKGCG
ncbi:MAG: retropepsin-like domain-containing protein, partial [Alphaproteobacteria bacterium]|nr:retropepsin-like domain-containing protein [Alphaproteobacteria bacterium]